MGHHRYINLGLGLEKDPPAGKAGGERSEPASKEEMARALSTVKRRLEGLKFDGYVIVEISADARVS